MPVNAQQWLALYASDIPQCQLNQLQLDSRKVSSGDVFLAIPGVQQHGKQFIAQALAQGAALHPMQQAFIKHDAFQCGYCTPGQICSAVGLATEGRAQSSAQIAEMMSGNLCRCGAYSNIRAAIEEALPACTQRAAQGGGQ